MRLGAFVMTYRRPVVLGQTLARLLEQSRPPERLLVQRHGIAVGRPWRELYRERNELDTAAEQLQKSQELGDLNGLPKNPYRWRAAMARIQESKRDLDGALELLEQAERLLVPRHAVRRAGAADGLVAEKRAVVDARGRGYGHGRGESAENEVRDRTAPAVLRSEAGAGGRGARGGGR